MDDGEIKEPRGALFSLQTGRRPAVLFARRSLMQFRLRNSLQSLWLWLSLVLFLAACGGEVVEEDPAGPSPNETSSPNRSSELVADTAAYDEFEIISVLPRDAIPAIFDPEFFSAAEADGIYAPDELVMGVVFDGDARAYSVPYLSRHEIVNDEVGGVKIAVTW